MPFPRLVTLYSLKSYCCHTSVLAKISALSVVTAFHRLLSHNVAPFFYPSPALTSLPRPYLRSVRRL